MNEEEVAAALRDLRRQVAGVEDKQYRLLLHDYGEVLFHVFQLVRLQRELLEKLLTSFRPLSGSDITKFLKEFENEDKPGGGDGGYM